MQWTQVGPIHIFLLYVLSESSRAVSSFDEAERLSGIVEEREGGGQRLHVASVLESLRLGLQASANVSRVFWPVGNAKDAAKARAERLRELCALEENHRLSNRKLRDSVEHFDERLDTWVANGPRSYMMHEMVAHPVFGDCHGEFLSEGVLFVYDVADGSVHILGEKLSVNEIKDAVKEVQGAVARALGSIEPDA